MEGNGIVSPELKPIKSEAKMKDGRRNFISQTHPAIACVMLELLAMGSVPGSGCYKAFILC